MSDMPKRHDHLATLRAAPETPSESAMEAPEFTPAHVAYLEAYFGPEAQIKRVREDKDDPIRSVQITAGWGEVLRHIHHVSEQQANVRSKGS